MYQAENIDTDKAIKHIDNCLKISVDKEILKKSEIEQYYKGYREGLYEARDMFYCCNYEKDN